LLKLLWINNKKNT